MEIMRVSYNKEHTVNEAELSGFAQTSAEFAEGKKAEIKFAFWWDKEKKEITAIEKGELIFGGRTLAHFQKFGNFGNWVLNEHRDNYPDYSELVKGVFSELEKKLAKDYPSEAVKG